MNRYFVEEPVIWVCLVDTRYGTNHVGIGFDGVEAEELIPIAAWKVSTCYDTGPYNDIWDAEASILNWGKPHGEDNADASLNRKYDEHTIRNADASTTERAVDAIEQAMGGCYRGCFYGLDESQPAIKSVVDYVLARVIRAEDMDEAAECWRWLLVKAANKLDEIEFYA